MNELRVREGVRLSDEQRLSWLQLIRSENVGPVAFRQLINRFGSADTALEAIPDLARRSGARRQIKLCTREQAERELALCHRLGARFIALGEAEYPYALAAADAPPPLLAIMGDARVLERPCCAIVGPRNASMAGAKMAERIARSLGREGFIVVSGLARGVDAAAHRHSLETGTVACLAGGLDKPYPNENIPLLEDIVSGGGAAISEMPFGWTPRSRDFPRRNRLVAGLSLGVVVVEAAHRSGSLITARLANEMGRLVFAVPGSPLDPRAAGTNALIKQGAAMVTDGSDVLEALRPLEGSVPDHRTLDDDETIRFDGSSDEPAETERERIIEALGPTPMPIDELGVFTGMPPGIVQTVLLELELGGRLERHSGGFVSLLGSDL